MRIGDLVLVLSAAWRDSRIGLITDVHEMDTRWLYYEVLVTGEENETGWFSDTELKAIDAG